MTDGAVGSSSERIESVGALDPESRPAVYAVLSSLADNKYVLGRRYAEWCTGAPMLESAVAAAAMAQDELGHARSFYPLLRGFPEVTETDTTEESGWQSRPARAMACLDRKFVSWTDFVAANFLVDTALTALLGAATGSAYEPLGQRARKILQEEAPHWIHGAGWIRRLAADPDARPILEGSLRAAWDDAFTWFGQADDPVMNRLVAGGLLACTPDELRERLRTRVVPLLEEASLAVDLAGRGLPWGRWDQNTRRLRPAS